MSFNAKQRAVLLSVRDRKWQVICGKVRVRGVRNDGEREKVCPVCAAAIKVTPLPYYENAWGATLAVLDLSHGEVSGIVHASDNPADPNRTELLALLGVAPWPL